MKYKKKISLLMASVFLVNNLSFVTGTDGASASARSTDAVVSEQAIALDESASSQALTVDVIDESENKDIDITFKVNNDWGSGFSGEFVITNNTDKPVENWKLEFDFAHNIDSLWNGIITEHTDNHYIVTNAGYNSTIAAGVSLSIGFNGSPGLVNDEPVNYLLTYDGGSYSANEKNAEEEKKEENATDTVDRIIEVEDGETFTFNGNTYAYINKSMNWIEAKEYCESLGGHLVTITSEEEQEFIENTVLSSPQKTYYWLGGTRDENGDWIWVTGEKWDYTNWNWGEPNNLGWNEKYLHLYSSSKKWNDTVLNGVGGFCPICEWEETEVKIVAGTAFDYALFTGNADNDIRLYTNNTIINGDVHSNSGFYFQGNKLEINGTCETVGNINTYTSSGSGSGITTKSENTDSIELLDVTKKVINKISDMQEENIYFGQDKIEVEDGIGTTKSIQFNGTTFDGSGIMYAGENISYNVNSLNGNKNSQILLCADKGNIDINGSDIKINGVIYAPNGTVTINANSFEINGRIICDKFVFNGTTLRINAQDGDLDFIKDIIQKEDQAPIADFSIDSTDKIRDTENNTTANIKLKDKSYSPDGDVIDQRHWTIYYDKNNDSEYTEDEIVYDNDENLKEVEFTTTDVGRYHVSLTVTENTEKALSGNTEEKTLVGFEVKNVKPESSIEISKAKNVDITVGLGDVEYSDIAEYETAISAMIDRLAEKGINVNYSSILSSVTAQDSFAWTEYDHYNFKDSHTTSLDKHISFIDNDIIMTGYGLYGFKDFLYIKDDKPTEKNFTFNLEKDSSNWHSMDGGGFLFNTNITTPPEVLSDNTLSETEKQNKSLLSGYCLLFRSSNVILVKLTNVNVGDFRNTTKSKYEEVEYFGEVVKSAKFTSTNSHSINVSVSSDSISVWDNGKLLIDNYRGLEYMGGYGYGPIVSHAYHGCSQQSYFTFSDIKMNSVTGKSLKDAVAEMNWKQDALRYVVEISNSELSDVASKSEAIELANQILSKDAAFIGLGNDSNKEIYEDFISLGGFEGFYSENENVDSSVKMLEAKILWDIAAKNYNISQYLAAGTEADYTNCYSDFENDPIYEQEWAYSHDPNVFESNSGYASFNFENLTAPVTVFEKTGNYTVGARFRDNPVGDNDALDEYRLWSDSSMLENAITVHSKPIADADIELYTTADGGCAIRFVDKSYDPDHKSLPNKGIMSYEYKYKKLSDSDWTYGKIPSVLETGEQYFISIKVTDLEGETSEPFIRLINAVGNSESDIDVNAPEITLTADKTDVMLNEDYTVSASADDPDGIAKFSLYVNGELISSEQGTFTLTADTTGRNVVTCIAEDTYGNISQESLVINVKSNSSSSDNGDTEALYIKVILNQTEYHPGENVSITLDSNYPEQINKFEWYHNDEFIAEGMNAIQGVTLKNGINKIKLVVTSNTGETAEDTAICTFVPTVNNVTVAPIPEVTSPEHGSTLSGTVEFKGSVQPNCNIETIESYSLEYKPYPNTTDTQERIDAMYSDEGYTVIAKGKGSVSDDLIGKWDTTTVDDGLYFVRLVAVDNYNTSNTHYLSYIVKNNSSSGSGSSTTIEPVKEEMKLTLTVSQDEALIGDTVDIVHIANNVEDVKNVKLYVNDGLIATALGTTHFTFGQAGLYKIKLIVEGTDGTIYEENAQIIVKGSGFTYEDGVYITLSSANAKVNEEITLTVEKSDTSEISDIEVYVDGKKEKLKDNQLMITSDTTAVKEIEVKLTYEDGTTKTKSLKCVFTDDGELTPSEFSLNLDGIQTITCPTDISGTVKDSEWGIQSYSLAYRKTDSESDWTVFASSEDEVDNGVLGTFDPTMLMNGLYDLRLYATNELGTITSVDTHIIVDGNMKIGNMSIGFTDMNTNIGGVKLSAQRMYDSRNKTSGDFGYGWSLSTNNVKAYESSPIMCTKGNLGFEFIKSGNTVLGTNFTIQESEPHYICIDLGNGNIEVFRLEILEKSAVQSMQQQRIVTLCLNKVRAQGDLLYKGKSRFNVNVYYSGFDISTFVDPDGDILDISQLTYKSTDGTLFDIDTSNGNNPGLNKIRDQYGNITTFSNSGYSSNGNKGINFTRDSEGRITEISDAQGRSMKYTYDSNGDLVTVTNDAGLSSYFEYDDEHNLTSMYAIENGVRKEVARQVYNEEGRLIQIIDADNNVIDYTHDISGHKEAITDRRGNTTVYVYNDRGDVIETIDPYKNTKKFTYDSLGNKTSETDELGRTIKYTYDNYNITSIINDINQSIEYIYKDDNKIIGIDDFKGSVINMEYDDNNNLIKTTEKSGLVTEYEYDGNGNITGISDSIGKIASCVYNTNGKPSTMTDSSGNVANFVYDERDNCISKTVTKVDANNNTVKVTTQYIYDDLDRLTTIIDENNNRSFVEYDMYGNQKSITDSTGLKTEFSYDNRGNIVRIDYANGTHEEFTYDAEDNLISTKSITGKITEFVYDDLNRLSKKIYPNNAEERYKYDAVGNVIEFVATNKSVTKYVYDNFDRNTEVINALNESTYYTYNEYGLLESVTDANKNTYYYEYDINGNCVKMTLPDNSFVETKYDVRGRIIEEIDQNGSSIKYSYDDSDRLISVTDANNSIWNYTYDTQGNLCRVTDPNGDKTSYTFDKMNRLVSTTLAEGMSDKTVYDNYGNKVSYTDFNGKTTKYTYDDYYRLSTVTYAEGTTTKYTYATNGLLSQVDFNGQTTKYEYNDLDGLKKKYLPNGTFVEYNYYTDGSLKSVTTNFGTTSYEYDALGRVSKVTDNNKGVTEYSYDAVGNLVKVVNPIKNTTEYSYDNVNRLTSEVVKASNGEILRSYAYTLDVAGRRTKVVESGKDISNRTVEYAYDNLGRLEKEKVTENGEVSETSYTFDKVSNRLTKNDNGTITDYTYDSNNRLLTEGAKTYAYDKNGNTISVTENGVTTTYTYFDFGKIRSIEDAATKESYTYDHEGRRIRKESYTKTTGVTESINYLLNDSGLVYNVLAEYDDTLHAATLYTYGTDIISIETNGETNYYIVDGQGSTRALTNAVGLITDTYIYDAFGNITAQTGDTYNPYLYNQEQYDANTGLYYLRARYMNPSTGRFVSMDSYGGSTYDPVSLHKYLYANSSPAVYSDPSGYFSLIEEQVAMAMQNTLRGVDAMYCRVAFGSIIAGVDEYFNGGNAQDIINVMGHGAVEGGKWDLIYGGLGLFGNAGKIAIGGLSLAFGGAGLYGASQSYSNGNTKQGDWRKYLSYAGIIFGGFDLGSGVYGITSTCEPTFDYIVPGASEDVKWSNGGCSNANEKVYYYHSCDDKVANIIADTGFRTDLPNEKTAFHNNRYGRGVYLADTPSTALSERPGGTILKVSVNLGKNLDITNRGVIGGSDYSMTHGIARGARKHGFDSITFASAKNPTGVNTVIFDPKNVVVEAILRP